jgi:hypothetical protein
MRSTLVSGGHRYQQVTLPLPGDDRAVALGQWLQLQAG